MSVRDAFDRYVSVWSKHGQDDGSGVVAAELEMLVADNAVYIDVPSGHTFQRPEGIARMCMVARELYRPETAVGATLLDGGRFAIKFTCAMIAVNGK